MVPNQSLVRRPLAFQMPLPFHVWRPRPDLGCRCLPRPDVSLSGHLLSALCQPQTPRRTQHVGIYPATYPATSGRFVRPSRSTGYGLANLAEAVEDAAQPAGRPKGVATVCICAAETESHFLHTKACRVATQDICHLSYMMLLPRTVEYTK